MQTELRLSHNLHFGRHDVTLIHLRRERHSVGQKQRWNELFALSLCCLGSTLVGSNEDAVCWVVTAEISLCFDMVGLSRLNLRNVITLRNFFRS